MHKEGSRALKEWFEEKKTLVYNGDVKKLIGELRKQSGQLPKSSPGSKGTRTRLENAIEYLDKRLHMMHYGWLIDQDLEIGSGSVEGAVKHLVAKRFDNGSMRWIKERAEALLQLRAIEINGDWERFIDFVHHRLQARSNEEMAPQRLLTDKPAPLPTFGVAA